MSKVYEIIFMLQLIVCSGMLMANVIFLLYAPVSLWRSMTFIPAHCSPPTFHRHTVTIPCWCKLSSFIRQIVLSDHIDLRIALRVFYTAYWLRAYSFVSAEQVSENRASTRPCSGRPHRAGRPPLPIAVPFEVFETPADRTAIIVNSV